MQKFTVFTAILTVIIVVVVAEILVSNYFPSLKKENLTQIEGMELALPEGLDVVTTDVLGSDAIGEFSNYLGEDVNFGDVSVQDALNRFSNSGSGSSGLSDFEGEDFVSFSQNVYIRDDQIKSAGFVGAYLEEEANDGFLFKNIFIDDIQGIEISKTLIRTTDKLLTKVYIIKPEGGKTANEIYTILKTRISQGLDSEVNETNKFGAGSFYMNDSRRADVAFLVVKIGNYVYGFSYPKEFHAQISNLIQLIDLEI